MADTEQTKKEKENNFVFSGVNDYYGRVCANYGKKCDECKWNGEYRCRDGKFRG